MTYLAGRLYPPVTLACPVSHPFKDWHSAWSSCLPADLWMAPSTPPPPFNCLFAALTMASISRWVMSPTNREILSFKECFTEWLPASELLPRDVSFQVLMSSSRMNLSPHSYFFLRSSSVWDNFSCFIRFQSREDILRTESMTVLTTVIAVWLEGYG